MGQDSLPIGLEELEKVIANRFTGLSTTELHRVARVLYSEWVGYLRKGGYVAGIFPNKDGKLDISYVAIEKIVRQVTGRDQ